MEKVALNPKRLHVTVSGAAWNDARKGVYLKPLFKTCPNPKIHLQKTPHHDFAQMAVSSLSYVSGLRTSWGLPKCENPAPKCSNPAPKRYRHTGTRAHGHTAKSRAHRHTGTRAIDRHPGTRARAHSQSTGGGHRNCSGITASPDKEIYGRWSQNDTCGN